MSNIVLYDDMVRAISECRQIDEVKDIRDKARALAEYMRQAKDREQARKCDEIRLRAEIGAGRLLREQEMAKGSGSNQHKDRSRDTTDPKTLSDLGGRSLITKFRCKFLELRARARTPFSS